MEIREIKIRALDIPSISNVYAEPSVALPPVSPVTLRLGTPIVDLPGCVEAHPDSGKSKTLVDNDPEGTLTYCDGTVPSFNPIDYAPEGMKYENTTRPPAYKGDPPKAPEAPTPEVPNTPPSTAKVECPTEAQEAKEPVGTYIEGFRKKVIGYKLAGKECIRLTEEVPLPQQIVAGLPSAGTVMTTGGIAVVATSSALLAKPLADLLLKVIKPTVKKVMKKITTLRGKTVKIESLMERRDQQRIRNHAIRKLKGKE